MTRYLPDTNILINALNGKRGHKELLAALVVQGHVLRHYAFRTIFGHSSNRRD
jgi:predicted nucleic acid-binding protein